MWILKKKEKKKRQGFVYDMLPFLLSFCVVLCVLMVFKP